MVTIFKIIACNSDVVKINLKSFLEISRHVPFPQPRLLFRSQASISIMVFYALKNSMHLKIWHDLCI